MRCCAALAVVSALLLASCLRHQSTGPSPVKCTPAPPPDLQDARVVGHVSLDGHPTPLVRGPYTVVLDDRIVAVVRNADSNAAANVLSGVDPETIESIEMLRTPESTARYPGATGDILRIRRCYAATTH